MRPLAFVLSTFVALAGAGRGEIRETSAPETVCVEPGGELASLKNRALRERQRRALAAGDRGTAIEAQKELAARRPEHDRRWFSLAIIHLEGGDAACAVAALEAAYAHRSNRLPERLEQDPSLRELRETREFLESRLAASLARDRQARVRRRARFREILAALEPGERPPEEYVARDVCPFECCTYAEWTVLEDTILTDAAGSERAVGTARAGDTVHGVTGEVWLRPMSAGVVHEIATGRAESVPAGDVLFLLDPVGEGFSHVWWRGRVVSLKVSNAVNEICTFPDLGCWGELLEDLEGWPEQVWWVKVRLPEGTEGWTSEMNFGGIDTCA